MTRIHSSMSIETTQNIFHADDVRDIYNLTGKEKLLNLLNEAFTAAMISMLRFRQHYFLGQRFKMKQITDSFMYCSNDEQEHADWLAIRMVQLGGAPDFSLNNIFNMNNKTFAVDDSLMEMMMENLFASRLAITNYRDLIKFTDKEDPITSVMLNIILLDEERHAEALAEFIESASTQH
jgi:bacterioferritin